MAATEEMVQDFLSRPVKVASYPWSVDTASKWTFNPWALFFGNSQVASRLQNFANLSCTLCVKFLVNGNMFYYGKLMASYRPIPELDTTPRILGVPQDGERVTASQRHCSYVDPTNTSGVCMALPFFWPNNALSIPEKEWERMGEIDLMTLNDLQHANGSEEPLLISIWVWANDVTLSQPTSARFDVQDQADTGEHSDKGGIVSGPATAVAKVLSSLSTIPYIGKYAQAGSAIAQMGASMARVFGHSRPILSGVTAVAQRSGAAIAPIYTSSTAYATSLDAKKGVTIDPTTVGVDAEDQMAFASIVTRESYLTQFHWLPSQPAETLLFQVKVTPELWNFTQPGGARNLIPACAIAQMFEYWHGSMVFRFDVVKAKTMLGRLRIVYDPYSQKTNETNVNKQMIVDLSEVTDFEMKVGWGSRKLYLKTGGILGQPIPFKTDGAFDVPPDFNNGVVSVYVETELSTTSLVQGEAGVNVFVKMCDDFDFISPIGRFEEMRYDSIVPELGALPYPNSNIPPAVCVGPRDEYTAIPWEDGEEQYTGRSPDLVAMFEKVTTGGNYGTEPLVDFVVDIDMPDDIGPDYEMTAHMGFNFYCINYKEMDVRMYAGNTLLKTTTFLISGGVTGTQEAFVRFKAGDLDGTRSIKFEMNLPATLAKGEIEYFSAPLNPKVKYVKYDYNDDAFETDGLNFWKKIGWQVFGATKLRLNNHRPYAGGYKGAVAISNESGQAVKIENNGALVGYNNNTADIAVPRSFRLSGNSTTIVVEEDNAVPDVDAGCVRYLWIPEIDDVFDQADTGSGEGGEAGEFAPLMAQEQIAPTIQPYPPNMICAGESVASLRALAKRYTRRMIVPADTGVTTVHHNGPHLAAAVNGSDLLGYISPWYAGFRGSMNVLALMRSSVGGVYSIANVVGRRVNDHHSLNFSGTTFVDTGTHMEFNIPYYSQQRFNSTRARWDTDDPLFEDIRGELFAYGLNTGEGLGEITVHVAAGEDYSLFWFQGIPPLTFA